jgi:hypothetical protein
MALTGDVEMPRDGQRVRVVLEGDAWGICTTSDITGYGPFTVVSLGRGAA